MRLYMRFPKSKFKYEKITTDNLFRNVHKLIKVKIHLHHSHVTGEIFGYSHDFRNWKISENKNEIPLIAHNQFGFDMFYFMKSDRTSAWGSKDLNFGGNNLTNINFANIGGEVKFIGTLKYYQKSLVELASTLTEEEKESVKKLTGQYLNKHYYFCEVWKYLSEAQKERIPDIISEGKSNIPYEKFVNMHSLFSTPTNGIFFEKPEFFNELRQKAVKDSDYQTSFYLYKTLKIRHLGDMNDLYSDQDVTLLCEIYENRFQFKNDRYGFNPRK